MLKIAQLLRLRISWSAYRLEVRTSIFQVEKVSSNLTRHKGVI